MEFKLLVLTLSDHQVIIYHSMFMYILCNVGTIRPRILLEMKKDSLVSENIGSIVNSIVNSQPLSSKIDISKIFFGTQLVHMLMPILQEILTLLALRRATLSILVLLLYLGLLLYVGLLNFNLLSQPLPFIVST